jgi:RimJ/RimL family protein N-acetyltransferase
MTDLTAGPAPEPVTLDGHYCRIEPLSRKHAPALYDAVSGEGLEARYRYLPSHPPKDRAHMAEMIDALNARPASLFFALVDTATGLCGGHFGLIAIVPENRSIELGSVLYGRGIARTRIATEAFFLITRHVFETLCYRRFEWKCDSRNMASAAAAHRYGFTYEGRFRQHMIMKGESRDTDWFSILDSEWPVLKPAYQAWLDPGNFDADGRAKTRLATKR